MIPPTERGLHGFPLRLIPVVSLCGALVGEVPDVSLTDLTRTYDGSPLLPGFFAPEGVSPSFSFSLPGAEAPIHFRRQTSDPAQVRRSLSFAVQKTAGVGELLRFHDEPPDLLSEVQVTLANWAHPDDHPDWEAANPDGYHHPVKVDLYAADGSNKLTPIAAAIEDVLVPWVPRHHPDGSPYGRKSIPFVATIRFSEPVILAPRTMVLVSYNTRSTGFSPIGQPGPYDSLNLGLFPMDATDGVDDDEGAVLWVTHDGDGFSWGYPSTGFEFLGKPLFKLSGPSPVLPEPPRDAGTYGVTARFEIEGDTIWIDDTFTILPAPATVSFPATAVIADGAPKPIHFHTDPPGVDVELTYDGLPAPPTDPGTYRVEARVASPNHHGTASVSYQLGHDYAAWIAARAPSLPAADSGPAEDPDNDGRNNLEEYAFQFDPLVPEPQERVQEILPAAHGAVYRFRRNPHALDLSFSVLTAPRPDGPWDPLPADRILDDDDPRWLRVRVPIDGPRRFFQLLVEIDPSAPASAATGGE